MKRDAIAIKPEDNVGTAIRDLSAGLAVQVGIGEEVVPVLLVEDIPYGHKLAIHAIDKGENVLKYGEIIGRASCSIQQGAHVHVHNVESLRGRGDLPQKG
ncbi:MAG: UxaA family hydrolase [Desulfatiglandaceae bacterium]